MSRFVAGTPRDCRIETNSRRRRRAIKIFILSSETFLRFPPSSASLDVNCIQHRSAQLSCLCAGTNRAWRKKDISLFKCSCCVHIGNDAQAWKRNAMNALYSWKKKVSFAKSVLFLRLDFSSRRHIRLFRFSHRAARREIIKFCGLQLNKTTTKLPACTFIVAFPTRLNTAARDRNL